MCSPSPLVCSVASVAFETQHMVFSEGRGAGALGIVSTERTWSENEAK